MDYYEELGVPRDATAAEIREAYKLAVRLLHPDLQCDQRLKALAECQMRRLGNVVATLLTPRERARYDAAIANPRPPARFPPGHSGREFKFWHSAARHWFWILLGSLTVATGAWYGSLGGDETPPRTVVAEAASVPAETVPLPRTRTRAVTPASKTSEPTAGLLQRPAVREPSADTPAAVPTVSPSEPPRSLNPQFAALAADAGPSNRTGDSAPRFDGHWLFAADSGDPDRAGSYPARYVEFVLREENGRLGGDYRAVYARLDKAITPEVAFHVQGEAPSGSAGLLQWESKAGAKGELELTLQAPNRLLVKWWTTQFGSQEVLSSGVAGLMRLRTQ